MPTTQTVNASTFKARCLEILDKLANHTLERVTITKRGRVVGVLLPPDEDVPDLQHLHGFMRGSVVIPPGTDLTEPVFDDEFDADKGILHR